MKTKHKKLIEKYNGKVIDLKNKSTNNEHLFLVGNCVDVLRDMDDNSVSVIFTDPPYNAGLDYGKSYKDNLSWDDYYDQARKWFGEYKRILKDDGSIFIMNYPEINARLLPILVDELGLIFRRWITWHYPTNIGHSKTNFTRSQRSILYLTKTNESTFNRDQILQPYRNPDVAKVKERIKKGSKGRVAYDALSYFDLIEMRMIEENKDNVDYHEINLLKNISIDRLNKKHPCQLPLELIERFIKLSSKTGDVVLDPFAGTFTTSLAAARLGRQSIGIEINPSYVNLGKKRLSSL
jgi:site-specific DNA-methyltransferase (adenine-specific)